MTIPIEYPLFYLYGPILMNSIPLQREISIPLKIERNRQRFLEEKKNFFF
jgi:hypothetical protein